MIALVAVLAVPACAPFPLLPVPLSRPASSAVRQVDQRPPRVMIIGDSLADQFGSHAAVTLREAGVEVQVAAWWGWGLFTREQYDMGATVPLDQQSPDSMMRQVIAGVEAFDPDVVAFYSNHNYWPPYPRDASGANIAMSSPAFAPMAQTQLRVLYDHITAGGATVFMVEPAPVDGQASTDDNVIWRAYAALQSELGFGIIHAGDVVGDPATRRWTAKLSDCGGGDQDVRPDDRLHLTYFGAGLMGTATARALAGTLGIPLKGNGAPTDAPAAMLPAGDGYRLVGCDGATFGFGPAGEMLGGTSLGGPRTEGDRVVAATPSQDSTGAWLVTSAARVLNLGTATALGPIASLPAGHHAVGITSTGTGGGYWIADDSGRVHPVGDAPDLGSLTVPPVVAGSEHVVAMAGTPDHDGYWLLTDAGRIAAFGSAVLYGDLQGALPATPLVGIASHPGGEGYWVLDAAGDVHPFGAAGDHGSAADQDMLRVIAWQFPTGFVTEPVPASEAPTTAEALVPTPSGDGYWVWLANGAVCHFGDAGVHGGLHRAHIDFSMRLLGLPFYGPGACSQSLESNAEELSTLGDVASQDLAPLPDEDAVG